MFLWAIFIVVLRSIVIADAVADSYQNDRLNKLSVPPLIVYLVVSVLIALLRFYLLKLFYVAFKHHL